MRNYYRILSVALAFILCTTLTSCASRIPSMYKNISSPDNHSASSGKDKGQSDVQTENGDSSSQLVSDLPASVAVSGFNAENSRNNAYYFIPAPGIYSSVIPYVSIPDSSKSSTSDNPSTSDSSDSSSSSDNPSSDDTPSGETLVDPSSSNYKNASTIVELDPIIDQSFENSGINDTIMVKVGLHLCSSSIDTDAENGNKDFVPASVFDKAVKDFFGKTLSNPAAAGLELIDDKYYIDSIYRAPEHTKSISGVYDIGNSYFRVKAKIVSGQNTYNAEYVVKKVSDSIYGMNLVSQKIN